MTLTVTGDPTEGVIVTVAEYVPGARLLIFTENLILDFCPEVSLPLDGIAVNHPADDAPTVQCKPSPAMFVTLMDCDAGLLPPCVALKGRFVLSICIAGGVIVIVIDTVAGLPAIA